MGTTDNGLSFVKAESQEKIAQSYNLHTPRQKRSKQEPAPAKKKRRSEVYLSRLEIQSRFCET